ncbi:15007_t:CDS:2 [Dentiscutata erythropus]|uniref:15007_t:CDS:1 n=1 Tax=Dentiscutata erythropus TaxID=1348616 RepID=A0A9N9AEU4_9GLOM|nr:15007_t:CDS:2 [Dentiscutata erythropus]
MPYISLESVLVRAALLLATILTDIILADSLRITNSALAKFVDGIVDSSSCYS